MKKTLLSVIAGLAVVGSAFGVPSPADRKALCEKHPDKYVWVEKTEACVPINPCVGYTFKDTYCIETYFNLPTTDGEALGILFTRYAENVLHTGVKKVNVLVGEDQYYGANTKYLSIKTNDGGYYVFSIGSRTAKDSDLLEAVCWAYGKKSDDMTGEDYGHGIFCYANKKDCSDIGDFGRLFNPMFFDLFVDEDEKGNGCLLYIDDLGIGNGIDYKAL